MRLTIKVEIIIGPKRDIKSAFNLIVGLDSNLRRFSRNGFDDWLPANEQTLEVLRSFQSGSSHDHEVHERNEHMSMQSMQSMQPDEGFDELDDVDRAIEVEEANQIKELQKVKESIKKSSKLSLSRRELAKLREDFEKVFGVNVNQLSIVLASCVQFPVAV